MKIIPDFADEDEEREFWDTHDSTDYVDWSKAKRMTAFQLELREILGALADLDNEPDNTNNIEGAMEEIVAAHEAEVRHQIVAVYRYMLQCERDNLAAGHKWSSGDWRKFVQDEVDELTP